MSREKKHRHSHDHDQRADRPQSTDLADVIQDDSSAHAASAHQRRKPTDGPSEDDRFGEGATARDAEGRIIVVSIVNGQTQIGIGLGHDQGVGVGMEGYIKSNDGMVADFQIHRVTERVSYAFVDTTIDGIGGHHQVVVNPSSMPKKSAPLKDTEARIVGVAVDGGQTKITIARGSANGAHAGMPGYVIGASGKSIADFVVAEQHPSHCTAFVDLTVDEVHRSPHVMLNPSNAAGGGAKQDAHDKHHGAARAGHGDAASH